MTIQVVTAAAGGQALSNSVRTQYVEDYLEGAQMVRFYDQLASPIGKNLEELQRGTSVQVEFLSEMRVATSAISEVVDITPQALRDATASLTPTSRADALQASELILIQAYTNYGAKMYSKVGRGMMEAVEVLARDAATQGSNFWRGGTTKVAARSTLDAGTSGHRADDIMFNSIASRIETLKVPGYSGFANGPGATWGAYTHPYVYGDIRQGGNVVSIAQYQKADIILNSELGALGKFRLVISPWAKVFGGAGAANAAAGETTLQTAVNALAASMNGAGGTQHATFGQGWLSMNTTAESGNTHQPEAERVLYVGHTGSTVTILGEADNGGFRFPHAAGSRVTNDDTVYTIVFGGPESLAKIYATSVGEYGQIVGPRRDGLVDQFISLGYKWYGGFGILVQSRIMRAEVSSQGDA